jgi:hypothetical protein
MSYSQEFKTVDLLLDSDAPTRAVDAFSLSLIKAERQLRKLVTHLVYQFPCFGKQDVSALRQALFNSRNVYFGGLHKGFDALYPRTIQDLVGPEYDRLHKRIGEITRHRNKIFHGQLTAQGLARGDLLGYVVEIREWCEAVANGAKAELQFDGFDRNSFQKSLVPDLSKRFKIQIASIADYEQFVLENMG